MKSAEAFIRNKVRKHGKKFSLFLGIGILKSVFTIALSWLLIDIMSMKAIIGSTIVVVTVFILTYFTYVFLQVVKQAFLKYASTTVGFNIATILLITFFVDYVGLSGAVSSAVVAGLLFALRYLTFNKIGVINHGAK